MRATSAPAFGRHTLQENARKELRRHAPLLDESYRSMRGAAAAAAQLSDG